MSIFLTIMAGVWHLQKRLIKGFVLFWYVLFYIYRYPLEQFRTKVCDRNSLHSCWGCQYTSSKSHSHSLATWEKCDIKVAVISHTLPASSVLLLIMNSYLFFFLSWSLTCFCVCLSVCVCMYVCDWYFFLALFLHNHLSHILFIYTSQYVYSSIAGLCSWSNQLHYLSALTRKKIHAMFSSLYIWQTDLHQLQLSSFIRCLYPWYWLNEHQFP